MSQCAIGDGVNANNIRQCLTLLRDHGYKGTLSMECEGQGGPMIERSLAWLRQTLGELKIPMKVAKDTRSTRISKSKTHSKLQCSGKPRNVVGGRGPRPRAHAALRTNSPGTAASPTGNRALEASHEPFEASCEAFEAALAPQNGPGTIKTAIWSA